MSVLLPSRSAVTGWLINHADVGVIYIAAGNLVALIGLPLFSIPP